MSRLCAAHALIPHPSTPEAAVQALRVGLWRDACGALLLEFDLRADLAQIQLPAPAPGGRADGLWQHTCFEAFIAPAGAAHYREFNFSPSGAWAAYAFSDYRQRAADPPGAGPRLYWQKRADSVRLWAILDAVALPPGGAGNNWEIGLSAVIEHRAGGRSYWALAHAAAQPDFHLRAGFALALPALELPSAQP